MYARTILHNFLSIGKGTGAGCRCSSLVHVCSLCRREGLRGVTFVVSYGRDGSGGSFLRRVGITGSILLSVGHSSELLSSMGNLVVRDCVRSKYRPIKKGICKRSVASPYLN